MVDQAATHSVVPRFGVMRDVLSPFAGETVLWLPYVG